MPGPARLGARSRPSIQLGGVERWQELTEYRLSPEASDGTPFTAVIPVQEWWLKGEAYQSTTRGTLWRYTRDHAGETVAYRIAPSGNPTPTADRPHYVGRVIVGPAPELGGSASDRTFLYEFEWRVLGEPEEVTEA